MSISIAPTIPSIRRANKAEVAEFFGVSLPAVDGWIRRGCPVVQKGSKGIPWVFDLLEIARWRLIGTSSDDDVDPDKLPPNERLAWYKAEREKRAILKDDRQSLDAAEVAEVVATAFAALGQDNRAIPDRLERRLGISGDLAQAIACEIDVAMDAMATRLQSIMDISAVNGDVDSEA